MSFAGNHALPAMTGVYSSTERLKDAGITGKVMNKLMANALRLVLEEVPESLPDYVMKDKNLVPIHFALHNIHFPIDGNALQKAIRRLKFEELFLLQLSLLKQKYVRSRDEKGLLMPKVGEAFNICYNALPYDLTGAQKRVVKEIRADLMSGHQMNRLLQDYGSSSVFIDSNRKWVSGLYDGPYGSACHTAFCKYPKISEINRSAMCASYREYKDG